MEKKDFNLPQEIEEYKKFAFGKNLLQVAVALVLTTAFQKLVSSVSDNLLMPIINWFVTATNGNWRELVLVPVTGMEIEIGKFGGNVVEFFITTLILYVVYCKLTKTLNMNGQSG